VNATISGNYCSTAQIVDYPAGVHPVANWNDYTEVAPGGGYNPTDTADLVITNTGADVTGTVNVSWAMPNGGAQNSNDQITRPNPGDTIGNDIDDGHDQMMTGYLSATRKSPLTPTYSLTVSGLSALFTSYDVIVYFDGDSDVQPDNTTANNQFSTGIWADGTKAASLGSMLYGRDTEDFADVHTVAGDLGDYEQIVSTTNGTPTAGNYVRYSNLTSDSFFLEALGVSAGADGLGNDGGHGIGVTGFQIVGIPEPSSLFMLGFVGIFGLLRRRRN
jgi:hypothetical protein